VALGESYRQLAELTHPSFKRYAERFGLDFLPVIQRSTAGAPDFGKLSCGALLGEYERVIFVDTDVLISDDCENLLDIVPEDHFGVLGQQAY
jgi:hypothetical protein